MTDKKKQVNLKVIIEKSKKKDINYCCFPCFLQQNYCGFINTSCEKYLRKYITQSITSSFSEFFNDKSKKDLENIFDTIFKCNNKKIIKKDLMNYDYYDEEEVDYLIKSFHMKPLEITRIYNKSNIIYEDIFKMIDDKILSIRSNEFLKILDDSIIKTAEKIYITDDELVNNVYKYYFEFLEEKYEFIKKSIEEEKIYFVKTFMKKIYYNKIYEDIKIFFTCDIVDSLKFLNSEKNKLLDKLDYFNYFIDFWYKFHIEDVYVTEDYETMLHIACKSNQMELVKVILKSGIDYDYRNNDNYCAYQYLSSGTYYTYKKILDDHLNNLDPDNSIE